VDFVGIGVTKCDSVKEQDMVINVADLE